MSSMEIQVAGSAEHQRLASASGHDLDPTWFLSAFISVQVFERANMMHLNGLSEPRRSTVFADLSQESPFEFGPAVPVVALWLLFQLGLAIPGQRDASPRSYRQLLSACVHQHLLSLVA